MAMQSSTSDAHAPRNTRARQPLAMETIDMVEQAFGEVMSSLRAKVRASMDAKEAAEAEYDSWYPQRQHH